MENGKNTYKKKKIVCKELEQNKYELLTEKCLYIHKELYYGKEPYEENCTRIKHKCSQEGEKLKYINLIEVIKKGKTEFKDEEKHLYTDVSLSKTC